MEKIKLKYRPHQAQTLFHRDRYKVFARLISAGTGGGKTKAGGYEAFLWAFENPGSIGYAFEPTFKMVQRVLIPTLESPELFGAPLEASPLVKDFNRTMSRLTLINNSQVWMIGLEEPESAEGPNVDWIWSDETRLIRHIDVAWQVWMRRLRGSGCGSQIGLWCTTTPDMPKSFLHQTFEDPQTKLESSKVYRWGIDDNPYLTDDYRKSVKRAHSGGLYERFVLGRFAAAGMGTFEFDSTIHVFTPHKTILQKVVYGVDFGWTNPSAVIATGFDADNRAYALDEFYASRTNTETLIDVCQEMERLHGHGSFICDRSEPATIDQMLRAGLDARADESKREDRIRNVGGRFRDAGDGRRRLYVSPKCVNLISELQIYDSEKKENDHAVDALGYAISFGTAQTGPPAFVFV
jgi:phage terminase large subunit-like protein